MNKTDANYCVKDKIWLNEKPYYFNGRTSINPAIYIENISYSFCLMRSE